MSTMWFKLIQGVRWRGCRPQPLLWRSRLTELMLALVVCVLAGLPGRSLGVEGARLSVSPESVDLGVVETSSGQNQFSARFTLTNSGDAVLVLSRPQASCGCTKAQLTEQELAPGQSTELDATIDTTGRYGSKQFHVFMSGNFPDSPRRLTMQITIPDTRTGWELMPATLFVRDVTPVRLHVHLFDKVENVSVTAIDLPEGYQLLTPLPLALPPGGMVRVDIRGSVEVVAAGGKRPFTVHTNHAVKPQIQGWLNIVPPLQADTPPPERSPNGVASAVPAVIVPIEAPILRQLLESLQVVNDLYILDIRNVDEYIGGHIRRSLSFPSTSWQTQSPPWPETAMLVIVANNDTDAEQASEVLAKTACRHVLILRGGIPGWIAAVGKDTLVTGKSMEKR